MNKVQAWCVKVLHDTLFSANNFDNHHAPKKCTENTSVDPRLTRRVTHKFASDDAIISVVNVNRIYNFLCSNILLQTASPLPTLSPTLNSVKCYEASYQEKLEENYVFPFIDTKSISTVKMRYKILAQFIRFNVLDRRSFGQNHKSYFTLDRCWGWSHH